MATWEEIQGYLRATFEVVQDDARAIALKFSFRAGEQDLEQGVGLSPMEIAGRPWLTMVAGLFAESAFPLRTALLYQDRLPFGCLVLRKGAFLLRHGLPLEPLVPSELDWTVRTLASEAARLRANAGLHGPKADPFANYAE